MLNLDQDIKKLSGIGDARARKFTQIGLKTVRDLVYYFPRTYQDLSCPMPIASLRVDQEAIIEAEIVSIQTQRTRRGFVLTNVLVEDNTGQLPIVWFNQPFLARTFRQGDKYIFYGKLVYSHATGVKQLNSPSYERWPKIIPIYAETAGLSSKQLRVILSKVLPEIKNLKDFLPVKIVSQEKLMPLGQALWQVHLPSDQRLLSRARSRLAFDEMLALVRQFTDFERDLEQYRAPAIRIDEKLLKTFVSALPFKLTDGQRLAAWRIVRTMSSSQKSMVPLNCLLNGDVGSGKTVVALIASLGVIKAGYSVVWLAPTEILAQQHYDTVKKLTAKLEINVELVTGATKSEIRNPKSLPRRQAGETNNKFKIQNSKHQSPNSSFSTLHSSLIIGTHAVLYRKDSLANIGLVVIDEQHRFGVEQRRELLRQQASTGLMPHFLSLTATPIPRTLAMLLGGTVTLITLKEKPKERQGIITRLVTGQNRAKAYDFIDRQIASGRQVFIVVPLIAETNIASTRLFAEEKKALETESKRLRESIFAHRRIGILHGRMKKAEKDQIMTDFLSRKYDILVSTSVIEVGVDVPNATVMLIENADSFGLAQLHQFRGRVGRSHYQSYCFLAMTDESLANAKTAERLNILTQTNDGFIIAQKDLELRGAGNLFGLEQSGFMNLKFASLADTELIAKAKRVAEQLGT
jgi:ATP-dependent DNA helicase RecG